MASAPQVMTAEEVAGRLRLPLSTVYHLAKSGKLLAFQVGRSWRFPADAVDRLVGARTLQTRVLVVDADDNVRWSVREALRAEDCEIREASTGEAGQELAKAERFDVLFVGLAVALDEGRSLVRQLLTDNALSRVFVVTGVEEMEQTKELLEEGAVTLLLRPLLASQVVACVEGARRVGLGAAGRIYVEKRSGRDLNK